MDEDLRKKAEEIGKQLGLWPSGESVIFEALQSVRKEERERLANILQEKADFYREQFSSREMLALELEVQAIRNSLGDAS